MILSIALAVLAAQAQAVPQATPRQARWTPFDGVALSVNQDVLTMRSLTRDLVRWRRENPDANEAQQRAVEGELVRERVKTLLRTQGGEDMGIAEDVVQRRVRDNMDRIQARQNGWVGMSKFLESRDLTTAELQVLLRSQMLGELWEDSITGKGPGTGQRVVVDRYVRPGRLQFLHREAVAKDESLMALGGTPERVRIQQIVIDPAKVGGLEPARALAESLRLQHASGTSFDQLVAEHSVQPDNRGMGEYETSRLVRIEPALGEFLAQAQTDEVSSPIVGARGVVRVVKLLERAPRSAPEFAELGIQKKLADRDTTATDARRLGRAYDRRMQSSWVWPPEFSKRAE